MISIQTISFFRKRIKALVDYKRGVYAGVRDEIQAAFSGIPIEQIRSNRDMILMQNDAILIKLRLPDRRQHLSKANGYRLIYMVSMVEERVVLLDVYPKRGSLQQLDIPDEDIFGLLEQYTVEAERDALASYD